MNESEDLKQAVDTLMASEVVTQASIESLLFLCRTLATHCGISQIDGLSIEDWFQRQKHLQLEDILLKHENRDPGYAALLQSIVDESRKRLEGDNPP